MALLSLFVLFAGVSYCVGVMDNQPSHPELCPVTQCFDKYRWNMGNHYDIRDVTQEAYRKCRGVAYDVLPCLRDAFRGRREDLCAHCWYMDTGEAMQIMGEEVAETVDKQCGCPCTVVCGDVCMPILDAFTHGIDPLSPSNSLPVSECSSCLRQADMECPDNRPYPAVRLQALINTAIKGCPVIDKYLQRRCHWPKLEKYEDYCSNIEEFVTDHQECMMAEVRYISTCQPLLHLRDKEIAMHNDTLRQACEKYRLGRAYERGVCQSHRKRSDHGIWVYRDIVKKNQP